MTKEEASHLPESESALDAFNVVNQQYFMLGKTLAEIRIRDQKTIAAAGSGYLSAGFKFLANYGHDAYLREIGRIAEFWINQSDNQILFTYDLEAAATERGMPEGIVSEIKRVPNEPRFFIGARRIGKVVQEITFLVTPISFIVNAQKQPIEALAALARIRSEIRDVSCGMEIIDPENSNARGQATAAHFLKEAIEKHPDAGLSPHLRLALVNYPEGINSLPKGARYRLGNRGYI